MWTNAIANKLGRFEQTMREKGSRAALRLVMDRVSYRLANASTMYVLRRTAGAATNCTFPDAPFSFRFLEPEELWRFSADPANNLSPDVVARALQGGDLCFAGLQGKRLATHGWYARNAIQAEHAGGIALSFPSHVAYVYRVFTHNDFRGRRLNGMAMSLAFRELTAFGIEELLATVDWTNWASLRSFENQGFTNLGGVVMFGPIGRQWIMPPHAATREGIRFGRRADLSSRR